MTAPAIPATLTAIVAPARFLYRCGERDHGAPCPVEIAIDHPGYTLTWLETDSEDQIDAKRAAMWEAIVEVWHHGAECRTFTQEDFRRGAVRSWLESLHSPKVQP